MKILTVLFCTVASVFAQSDLGPRVYKGAQNFSGATVAGVSSGVTGVVTQCVDTSSSTTTYTCSGAPTLASYTGSTIAFIAANTNTGSSTINVDGLGTASLRRTTGGTSLASGEISANITYFFTYVSGVFREIAAPVGGSGVTIVTSGAPSTLAGTTTTLLHGNASGAPTFAAASLTADVTGTLPVANGGTGTASTLTGLVRGSASAMTAAELSGDVTTSGSNAASVVKVNGGSIPASAPLVGTNSSSQIILATPFATNAQTATYQVLAADFSSYKTIIVASGTFTITLVASGSQPATGQFIKVINYGSGVVTIARSGQNINGGTTSLSLPAASATAPTMALVVSDATNYFGHLSMVPNATGCTNQFVRTLNGTAAPTCASVANADITNTTIDLTTKVTGALPVANMAASTTASGTTHTLAAPREYWICTGTCTVTPPVPAAGYEFCVLNGDNVATAITLAALGSSAMYENSARTAYGTAGTGTLVVSAAAANKVCILGLDSTHYLTIAYNGAVTVN